MKISAMNSRFTRHSNSPRALLLPVVPLAGLFVEIVIITIFGLGNSSALAQERIPNATTVTPTAQPAAGTRPILKTGDRGESVSELQAMLKLLGFYNGAVDGAYQEGTATAVSAFQRAAGLTADGIAGTATWNRLLPAANNVTPVTPTPPRPTPTPTPTPTPVTPTPTNPAVPQPTTVSLPILRLGMRGSAISQLQQRLRRLGFFNGAVDGIFGTETENAVKAMQRNFGLEADGIVGLATWDALLQ